MTIDIEGKKYPNLTVFGNQMIRCLVCNLMGEIENGKMVWGFSREWKALQEKERLGAKGKERRARLKEAKLKKQQKGEIL